MENKAELQETPQKVVQVEASRGHMQNAPRNTSTPGSTMLSKLTFTALALAASVPLLYRIPSSSDASSPILGVQGGVMKRNLGPVLDVDQGGLLRRADSRTDVCTRWAHQSALVNGTLYIYGGEATTSASQSEDTWNNNFLSMDLTKTWQISSPSLTGLAQPPGPPSVALGSLWHSHDSLYLYGGEFSSRPVMSPTAFSLWEYSISLSRWVEHSNPRTSTGHNAPDGNQPVQRAAEGAGVSVPSLGRAWYFGGHQDGYTTEGWSQSIWRIYLKSLLEFTFPGSQNAQVDSLFDNKTAGSVGVWRNVTEGGLQDGASFPERADGLLLYVPGFGDDGILLGLAGGTNDTLTQMNVIDVFDITTSTWYKQSTSGPMPKTRVNPCAVVAAAPDGSSYNVYMFGGQNLQPAGNQTQLDDMWILTIPSFTWIEVDQSSQSVPYARAGHTCHVWDAQMIVVGGYVGEELSCDSPGIYVYDLSSLTWVQQFTALSSSNTVSNAAESSSANTHSETPNNSAASNGSDFVSNSETNPFNQQPAQLANDTHAGGLEGSYGYQVPKAVISVIGGAATGGATATTPHVTPTEGPLATGKPATYTVTQSNEPVSTGTSAAGPGNESSGSSGSGGPNIAAIVAGTIAGLLFLVVCYLAFCTWLYRKQVAMYKRHIDMAQRQALREKPTPITGLFAYNDDSTKTSSERRGTPGISSDSGSAAGNSGRNNWGHNRDGSGTVSLLRRTSSESGQPEDLIAGHEPTFLGVMLAPRRSLRVINL